MLKLVTAGFVDSFVYQKIRIVPPVSRPFNVECDVSKPLASGLSMSLKVNFMAPQVSSHLDRFFIISGIT
jgi:hypothetical protein